MNINEKDITGFNTHIHYVNGIPMDCCPKSYKYILELEKENKLLKQWDKDKDTRNSRQRIANKKLLEENKLLKQALNEIKEIIQRSKAMDFQKEKGILQIIDKVLGSDK